MVGRKTSDPDVHPEDAPSIPFGEPIYEQSPMAPHAPFIGDITQLTETPVRGKKKRRIGFRPPGKETEE